MPTVFGYTLGCKVSQYETEAIIESFEREGFTPIPTDSGADVYVINTCTVTAESDRKSRQMIRRCIGKNPEAVIAVCGCYSQRSAEQVAAIDGVSLVFGTDGKMRIASTVAALMRNEQFPRILVTPLEGRPFEPMSISRHPRTRAYLKIEDGCECRCSYCAIAAARGPVRSKLPEQVIAETEALSRQGAPEIVLTGIETGSYGRDLDGGVDLGSLIAELDRRGSCKSLRLGSLAPELCGEAFVEKIKDAKILAPHFHLSFQSGSDSVLGRMRRRYTRKSALENIRRIRENIPGATFTTDLMVGFPGETDEDFQRTLELVREARFLDAHVFAYSRRSGTVAADMPDQIPESVKRERSRALIEQKNRVRDSVLDEIVAEGELDAVLEGYSGGVYSGHTATFAEIALAWEDGHSGEWVRVVPVSHKNGVITVKLA